MNPRSTVPFLAAVVLLGSTIARADRPAETITFDLKDLTAARARYQTGDPATVSAVRSIVKEADKQLDLPLQSVMNKQATPPSGDKHDYMSLSPYWWPDPSKPDGKPYIRKDGLINPERLKYDLDGLEKMSRAVDVLSLAYYLTGEEKYADKCASLLRTWYLDPATRMNPSVQYAQFVPGYTETRPSGVIESNRMRCVCDADALISGSRAWTAEDHKQLQAWFKDFLKYLLTSPQGQKEMNQPNNHGTWFAVQTATYAIYLGDDEQARQIIKAAATKRIASQIEPDGKQPHELARTKAFDYSRFNLEALGMLALYGERYNLDLWHFRTPDGRSLSVALDWLAPYASGDAKWEGSQIVEPKMVESIRVYRWAANALANPKYEDVVRKAGDPKDSTTQRVELVYPSTLK